MDMTLIITEVKIGKDSASVTADGYSHVGSDEDKANYSFVSVKIPVSDAMKYPVGSTLKVTFELG